MYVCIYTIQFDSMSNTDKMYSSIVKIEKKFIIKVLYELPRVP